MQVGGARGSDAADHVLEMKWNPVRVSDGDVQDPLDVLSRVGVEDHLRVGLIVVLCKSESFKRRCKI